MTGLDDIEEFVAEVEPVVHGIDGCGRGYDAQVGGLGEAKVVLAVTEEGFNEFGIVYFIGLLFAKFRHGGLQEAEIGAVFICELVEALGITDGVQGMHDAMIEAEAVVEFGNLTLVGVAFFWLGVDLLELPVDGLKVGAEIVKGIMTFSGLGESFESEFVREFNFEDGVGVGPFRVHREVEEPLDRTEGLPIKGFDFLTCCEDEQSIAGDGIEGLDASTHLNRELCKGGIVIAGFGCGGSQVTPQYEDYEEDGEGVDYFFHASLLFLRYFRKWSPN